MNTKPLCIASIVICFITACAMEGEVLLFGQAIVIVLISGPLAIWSFMHTDLYDPVERESHYEYSKVPQMSQNIEGFREYQHWIR